MKAKIEPSAALSAIVEELQRQSLPQSSRIGLIVCIDVIEGALKEHNEIKSRLAALEKLSE